MEGPEEYEVSLLMSLSPEYLLGEPENPGPLVRLAYPEVMKLRLVSRKFRDLIDTDYFWELKTRRDFGVEEGHPKKESWKAEYLLRAQKLAPELLKAAAGKKRSSSPTTLGFGCES